jgi:hypothetical protein
MVVEFRGRRGDVYSVPGRFRSCSWRRSAGHQGWCRRRRRAQHRGKSRAKARSRRGDGVLVAGGGSTHDDAAARACGQQGGAEHWARQRLCRREGAVALGRDGLQGGRGYRGSGRRAWARGRRARRRWWCCSGGAHGTVARQGHLALGGQQRWLQELGLAELMVATLGSGSIGLRAPRGGGAVQGDGDGGASCSSRGARGN